MSSLSTPRPTLRHAGLIALSLVAMAGAGYALFNSIQHPAVCLSHSKVERILALNYRDATIQLADGSTRTVNQATLKPGDDYCLAYGRK